MSGACGARIEGLATPGHMNPTHKRFYLRVAVRPMCYGGVLGGDVIVDAKLVEWCEIRVVPPDMAVCGLTTVAREGAWILVMG